MPPKGRKGQKKNPVVEAVEEHVEVEAAANERRDDEDIGPPNSKQYDWKEGHQEPMADFSRDHPEFYDKSHLKYKDSHNKKATVESFLEDMRVTFEEILKPLPTYAQFLAHLRNMRTRFNRYSTKKSRQPAHTISAKETFIAERYSFLRRHIEGYRRLAQETHSFGRGRHSIEENDENDDDYEDEDDDAISVGSSVESSMQSPSTTTSSATTTLTKRRRTKKLRKESGDVAELEILDRVQNLLGNINQPLSKHQKRVQEFVRFLETEILQVPEHQFNNCSLEVMNLVRNFQAYGGIPGNQSMPGKLNQTIGVPNRVQPVGMSSQMQYVGMSNQFHQFQPMGMSNQLQDTSHGMHQYRTQQTQQPIIQSWRNGQNFATPGGSTGSNTGATSETSVSPSTCGTSNLGVILSGALNTSTDCESTFEVSDTTSMSTHTAI